MSNNLTVFGKITTALSCLLLLVASAAAQPALRKALDTDNDGKADFSVFRPSDNIWYIAKSGGGFLFQQFGDATTDTPTPGDYDGDGKGDIAVFRDTNGSWYWINSSNGTVSGAQFGISGDEPVQRDYDGDGKTDLAVVRRSNNLLYWYIQGTLKGFITYQFGVANDFTAPGDYDGDGKFDLAVQRGGATGNAQAYFFILNSHDNSVTAAPWGVSDDIVVPGDYDGDGKTDLAVVRAGVPGADNLAWFIVQSRDNSIGGYYFGLPTDDLTAQADYDGDGKTDVGVWRNSNGTFYFLQSGSNNTSSPVQWGAPNDSPIAGYDTH